jgi:hypothetical protein
MTPSVVRNPEASRHLDAALLDRLEVRRFDDPSSMRPTGQRVLVGQSYTDTEEDEEDTHN